MKQDKTVKWIILCERGAIWAMGTTKKNCIFHFNYVVGEDAYQKYAIDRKIYRLMRADVYWEEIK